MPDQNTPQESAHCGKATCHDHGGGRADRIREFFASQVNVKPV